MASDLNVKHFYIADWRTGPLFENYLTKADTAYEVFLWLAQPENVVLIPAEVKGHAIMICVTRVAMVFNGPTLVYQMDEGNLRWAHIGKLSHLCLWAEDMAGKTLTQQLYGIDYS